jgi:predicted metal-dependent hydrolase
MLEEIEHRNVAFDIYEHLYGGGLYRARMCWVAQSHILRFIRDCTDLMSSADVARRGERYRVRLIEKVVGGWGRAGKRVRSMLPGYTPHDYHVPERVAELSAYYTELAVSAT